MGNIAAMWTLPRAERDIKQNAQLVADFAVPGQVRPDQARWEEYRYVRASRVDQSATVAGAEEGVMIPRTCSVCWRITGWERLLGRFVDGCIFSPEVSPPRHEASHQTLTPPDYLAGGEPGKTSFEVRLPFGVIDEIRESLGLYPKSINHEAGRRDSRLRG